MPGMESRSKLADVGRTARQRLTVRHVLFVGVFLGFVYALTREPGTTFGVAVGLVVVETVQILGDTPSIDDRWIGFGVGTFVTLGSLIWLGVELTTTDTGGPAWFPALTALVGVWFLLDARGGTQSYGNEEEMGFTEVMTLMNHASLVVDELEEEPKTVEELAEACDLTESRVREAIEVGAEEGTIYRVAGNDGAERYALDESKVGPLAFVRVNAKRLLGRLARPFR